MQKYQRISYEVRAIQFTGGLESASEIVNYINQNDPDAQAFWMGETPSYPPPVEGAKISSRQPDFGPERIQTDTLGRILVGAWLVRELDGRHEVLPNEEFIRRYQQVEEPTSA